MTEFPTVRLASIPALVAADLHWGGRRPDA